MNKQQRLENGHHIAAGEKVRAGVPLSIQDWCALEGVSRQQFYSGVARGDAPAFYYNGGIVRIAAADYIAWVEVRKAAAKRGANSAPADQAVAA